MEPLSGQQESLWMATSTAVERPPAAAGDRYDVVVVGAGITGLTTALLCKRAGARVAVLEMGRVCQGVTAYTTAKLTALHQLVYADFVNRLGEERARVYGQANQAAIGQVAAFVEQYGIDCAFERRPAYTYTEDSAQVEAIEAEVAAAQGLGLPASFTTDTDLPWAVRAAVRFDEQAQFHPRAYALGLAEQVDGDGSAVFERSRVMDVRDGTPCRVVTEHGAVTADAVVIATLLPFLDRGGFFARAHPTRSYALAVETDRPGPQGMYISAESPTRSVRSYEGGLVVAGEGHTPGAEDDERVHWQRLTDWSRERFGAARPAFRWSAHDYVSDDGMPYIGKLSPVSKRVWIGTGFRKWGLTNGTVAAMILSEAVLGRRHPWGEAFDAQRVTVSASAKSFVSENLKVGKHFVTDRLGLPGEEALAALGAGQGAVVRLHGRPYAVCRDDDGAVHSVSPVCTHLACHVSWNTGERSWDCPCHGSRYAPDGTVIQGPATRDLEPRPLPGDIAPG